MGLQVDGIPISDPSSWEYQVSSLDLEGKRDSTGYLHRKYVTTKINYKFEWKGLDWVQLSQILNAVDKEKFELIAPDPRRPGSMWTGDYYVGDRTGTTHYFWEALNPEDTSVFTLKMNFIQF